MMGSEGADVQDRELAWIGIQAIQREIETDAATVEAIVDAALARIDRLDPMLQSYSVVWPERARRTAARLDAERSSGKPPGLLHGVPIAVKDLCDVRGEPTRAGTTALGDAPAAANAEVVDRLEAAGAVILGKLKMTEGALVSHHPSVTPPVNPWNAERWTGISSSGSGVSLAAGLCVGALGTDTGGSIRFPSAACGLSGLKPTHGRVSLRGIYPLADSLDHIGPMARSVDDVARIFSVLCGFDEGDPWSLARNPPVAAMSALESSVRGIRIGYDPRYGEEGVDPQMIGAVQAALEAYRELGAEIVEIVVPDVTPVLGAWIWLGSAEIARAHAETFANKAEEYGDDLRRTIEQGLVVEGTKVAESWKARIAFSRRLEALFDEVDILAAPVIPGRFAANTNLFDVESDPQIAIASRFTSPFNLSGSPSLTMCGGFDSEDAPIGFQLVGAHRDEARLLALGSAFQAKTDWHTRHPAL
ncbi:MAG: Asp-tRNA(Asn)/Glu-tRNA(Gln) amidotransferase GatCAB subunit A [Deltaproteobacteria bacterium]|nr:Asp-tRNA(Asn)/Glu-tRNA(Gln) amidotransferase GatCAB subunit A [Deltaproteobacteria bacterium]